MKSIKSIFHGRQWLMEMPDTSQISPKRKMFAEVWRRMPVSLVEGGAGADRL